MMELNIEHRFVANGTPADEGDVYLGEYFHAGGYERALACTDAVEAERILAETFKGRDADGVVLIWRPVYYPD